MLICNFLIGSTINYSAQAAAEKPNSEKGVLTITQYHKYVIAMFANIEMVLVWSFGSNAKCSIVTYAVKLFGIHVCMCVCLYVIASYWFTSHKYS